MRKFVAAVAFIFFLISQGAVAQNTPGDIPLENFGALAKNSNVRMSPDGTHFSIVSFIQGKKYVVVTPVGGQPIAAIPPYDGMAIDWAFWLNNDYLIIQMSFEKEAHSAFGKVNATRLISVSKDGKKVKNMAKPARVKGSRDQKRTYMPDYAGTIIDTLPNEPDFFLLTIDEDGTDMSREVRKVNVKNGNYKLVMDFYGDIQNWMTDQQGEIRYGRGIRRKGTGADDEESVLFYHNPETEEWVKYTQHPSSEFQIAGFFEDPRYAYAFKLNEEGFRSLYKYDMIAEEEVESIFSIENYDLGGLIFHRYEKRPIGVSYITTRSYYHYFDSKFSKIQRILDKSLPNSINTIDSYNRDETLFVIRNESDIESGAYYLFNYEPNNMRLDFMEASYVGLQPRLLSPTQSIEYEARDGLIIPAYLTVPKDLEAKNLPTIIMPHGGPEARDSWGYRGSTFFITQYFVSRGYVVLQPNFRGSRGYGKDFANAGRKEWGLKMQDDVTDGALWMIEQGIADPERMCIMGWSYGGYVAMTATFNTPDLYKCSVSINGVSDLPGIIYEDRNFLGASYWKRHIGEPGEDKDKLKKTSAIYNVDKIHMPILVIANRDDTVVDYKQSKKFVDKMKNKGKQVTYFEIKEGGHSALEGDGRSAILREMEKFINEHIGGGS